MSVDEPLAFIDTNLFVYAMGQDDVDRSPIAVQLIERLSAVNAICTSAQVLQETYVTLTRKGRAPLPPIKALEAVRTIAQFPVVTIDFPIIEFAIELSSKQPISFWDALLIGAASRAGAARLYTEDLQHGSTILGVEIVNPFLAA
jgi:predicted nucleic acid-binding protein